MSAPKRRGYRDNGRGTLTIDRRLPGIGRLKIASGTTNTKMLRRLNGMLDALVAAGRLDVLRSLDERVVTPLEVWDAYRLNDLDRLPSAETIRRLWPTLETWRLSLKGEHHKRAIKSSIAQLRRVLTKAEASIVDLPRALALYRAECEANGAASSFNHARSHTQAFLRDTVGRTHRLYHAVADLQRLDVERAEGNPFTAKDLFTFLTKLEARDPAHAAIAQSMAFTGMRPTEYFARGGWEVLGDRVRVKNAKPRPGKPKYRVVPLIGVPTKPERHRRTFENVMREVAPDRVAYDLRRTFAHLMERAKIDRSRRMAYLGHMAGDVTALYEGHQVEAYLAEDRAAILAYLAAQQEAQPQETT